MAVWVIGKVTGHISEVTRSMSGPVST